MAEFLVRRMQLQEDVIADCPTAPNFQSARHYMGSDERAGGALLAPSLRAHIGSELEKEAKIAKERRKASEVKTGYVANPVIPPGAGGKGGRGARGRGRGHGGDGAAPGGGGAAPAGP